MIWKGRDDNPGAGVAPIPSPAGSDLVPRFDSDSVGARVDSVLDAAEQAAAGIRDDAREWARQYLQESQRKADEAAAQRVQEVSVLTDQLMARARAVAKQSDELIAALDAAGHRLLGGGGPVGAPSGLLATDHSRAQPAAASAEPDDPGASEGARLLASQMAVAGSTRDEIASRLREDLGIQDPAAILDEIGL